MKKPGQKTGGHTLMHLKNKTLSVFGILLFSVAVFMLAGCASQRDFTNLKTELDALKARNDKLEKDLGTISSDKAQSLKNQASIQSQFNDLQTQIREIQGKIEELSAAPKGDVTKIRELEARIKVLEDSIKGQVSAASSKSQYDAALEKYRAGKNLEALKAFDAYVANNPNGDLIDNASFWAGECLFAEGNFEAAMDRYDMVLKNYPKSPKVPDCLYKEGVALIELGDNEAGRLSLEKVVKTYPDTEAAKKAKAKLGEKAASKSSQAKKVKKKK
jgi:tol-pal system protein YbgF